MLWHIVRFRFSPDVDDAAREGLADALRDLTSHIDELRFLRVAPSIDDPDVLGLLTGFDDADALAAYQVHEAHQPVVALSRSLCADIVKLDVVTDDPPDLVPREA